jgi:hypothetical protein
LRNGVAVNTFDGHPVFWYTRGYSTSGGKTSMTTVPIPEFTTLREVADFWDTHSTADYFDVGREVHFEVAARRRPRRIVLGVFKVS